MDDITIAIDFDGTIVEHEYPKVGKPNITDAIGWMKRFQEAGARLILFTMRSNTEEHKALDEAVAYIEENGIKMDGINVNPGQEEWTSSPKAYAQIYIDDAAFGCPLIANPNGRPFVDWTKVGPAVLRAIVLST